MRVIFTLEIYNEDEYDSIWKWNAKLTQCTGANGETKYFSDGELFWFKSHTYISATKNKKYFEVSKQPNIDLESLEFESLTPLRPIFL